MARITPEERAKREAELETKMNEFVKKATYKPDPAELAAMSAIAFLNVPFIARFGKELGMKLVGKGYKAPEELLLLDAKSLNLASAEITVIKKYQRKYLPKRTTGEALAIDGPKLRAVLKELSGHDVETSVSKVRFRANPMSGFKVLIERPGAKALFLS